MATHLDHAMGFAEVLIGAANLDDMSHGITLADLGSGAGVPGLVLAVELLGARVELVDAKASRGEWLEEAVAVLGLEDRVRVRVAEAQALGRLAEDRHRFDAVVARGFAPPSATAEVAAGLLSVGGWLVVSEPPSGSERWDGLADAGLGFGAAETIEAAGYRYMRARLQRLPAERFPRQGAGLRKRPLF